MTQTKTFDTWEYRDASLASTMTQREIVGYDAEALDGSIGKIDGATLETDSGHIVVDTGPWIFGKKVMLPVGVLTSADHEDQKVFVNRTKDEIKNVPEFDDSMRNSTRRTAPNSARTTARGDVVTAIGTEPTQTSPRAE